MDIAPTNRNSTETEIWRPVPGFDGRLTASSLGRIRDSRYPAEECRPAYEIAWRVSKGKRHSGYPAISFYKPAPRPRQSVIMLHRLVALAFLGNPPTATHQVNHIDGNKANCRPENLEWVTPAENTAHARRTGLTPSLKGALSPSAKYPAATIRAIKRHLLRGCSIGRIAIHYGIELTLVSHIKNGKRWAEEPPAHDSLVPPLPLPTRRFITDEVAHEIRALRAAGMPGVDIARMFEIRSTTVSEVVRGVGRYAKIVSPSQPLPLAV